MARESKTSTNLEYLIDLLVRRTISEHGGDVAAATDVLRRMSPFMGDDATRALLCDALDHHSDADQHPVVRNPQHSDRPRY